MPSSTRDDKTASDASNRQHEDVDGTTYHRVAYRDFARKRAPMRKNINLYFVCQIGCPDSTNCTYGSGAARVVSPANIAVAPTAPMRMYICLANSGKAAADEPRINVLEAIADAATGRYAVTR